MSAKQNLLRKITVKDVFGRIKFDSLDDDPIEIMRIVGIVSRSEVKSTAYGDSVAFKGQFKATNMQTGEEFHAATCYLPGVAGEMLEPVVANSSGMVEFGFIIGAKPAEDKQDGDKVKYEYIVKPLMELSDGNDPISSLDARLESGAVKMLVAPGDAKKPAATAKKPAASAKKPAAKAKR